MKIKSKRLIQSNRQKLGYKKCVLTVNTMGVHMNPGGALSMAGTVQEM